MNLKTSNINVIPAGRKSAVESRLTSEKTFTNIIKILSMNSDGSFIIGDDNSNIEFCLEGYYISASKSALSALVPGGITNLYAKCVYAQSDIQELQGDDGAVADNPTYLGVDFTTTVPATPYLQIYKNGSVNPDVLYSKLWQDQLLTNYSPYFTATETIQANLTAIPSIPVTPEMQKKIWVNTTSNILEVYINNTWVPLGAVAL